MQEKLCNGHTPSKHFSMAEDTHSLKCSMTGALVMPVSRDSSREVLR